MEVYQNRIDSFSPKRLKKGGKLLKWPHPDSFIASKVNLAEAGFYFDPSDENPDNVTCFMCQKELGDWEEEDDPFALHFAKCASRCAWANLRCGLQHDLVEGGGFKFAKDRVPTSKAAEKERLKTFKVGPGWPHGATHSASAKNMANAGFVYTPAEVGDDEVTCLFCQVSLSGWKDGDDAREEHKKRSKRQKLDCPMFPNSPSSSKSRHEELVVPVKLQDGDADELGRSTTQKTPRRQTKKGTGAKTPATRGRNKSKPPSDEDEDEEEDEEEEDTQPERNEPPPPEKKKRKTKQTAAKPSRVMSDDEGAEESEVASIVTQLEPTSSAVAPKKVSAKGKTKASEAMPPPESEVEEQSTLRRSRSTTSKPRSKPTRTTRTTRTVAQTEEELLSDDELVAIAKPPSHSRTRSASSTVNVDPPPRPPKSPSRRLGKAKGKVAKSDVSDEEEAPTPVPVAKPKPKPPSRTRSQSRAPSESESERPTRVTRKASKAKVVSDAEDEPARKRKPTTTRKASKANATVIDTEEEEVEDAILPTSVAGKTKASKSKSKSADMLSAMSKATTHIPSPVKEVDEDDLSMSIHIPPPSPSPPKRKPSSNNVKRAPSFVDLAELTKPKTKPTKPAADPISTTSHTKSAKLTPQGFFGASQPASQSRDSIGGVDVDEEEAQPRRMAKLPLHRSPEEKKQPMRESALRVVDISSDEDSPVKPKAKSKSKKPVQVQSQSSAPIPAPEPVQETVVPDEDSEIPAELPRTPPRRTASAVLPPSPMVVDVQRSPSPPLPPATAADPEFYPPLSSEPFINVTSFTDDELDMTVEDWILQQVEQQLSKFKIDGETYLQQMEKEAEVKRRAIEALN